MSKKLIKIGFIAMAVVGLFVAILSLLHKNSIVLIPFFLPCIILVLIGYSAKNQKL